MDREDEDRLGLLQRIKNGVLPSGPAVRTLRFGIGRGLRLELDFQRDTRLYLGLYERELNSWLRSFCRPGSLCFDVGADAGYDALVMARLGAKRVLSIECRGEAVRKIQRNFGANSELTSSRCEVMEAFVSNGTVNNTVTLDKVAASGDAFVPGFIKIDIEGSEGEALEGAARLLAEHKPDLIVETHGLAVEEQCVQLLRGHGYTPVVIDARKWLPDYRPSQHNRWLVARGRDEQLA